MKYTNGVRVIEATKRAYEVIYKNQGFREYEVKNGDDQTLDTLSKKELIKLAEDRGVEISQSMTKANIIEALKG